MIDANIRNAQCLSALPSLWCLLYKTQDYRRLLLKLSPSQGLFLIYLSNHSSNTLYLINLAYRSANKLYNQKKKEDIFLNLSLIICKNFLFI